MIEAQQQELQRLQERLERLEADSWSARQEIEKMHEAREEAEAVLEMAVTRGDHPGTFNIPGTNTSVKIGGYVKADFIYDIGPENGDSFAASAIPADGTAGDRRSGKFRAHARQTRLNFSTWTPTEIGEALHWLGVLDQQLGRPAAGRACLARAVALDPASPQRRYHYAEALRAAGEHGEAVEHYRAALERASGVADIWLGLGTAQLALGEVENAIQSLERARSLAPGDATIKAMLEAACAESAFRAGERLRAGGRLAEAAGCYRRAIELDPTHSLALVNLGVVQERQGEAEAALDAYERAVAIDPGLPEARLNLGIARAVAGDREAARGELEAAVAAAPTLGVAHYHLALLDDAATDRALASRRDAEAVERLERLVAADGVASADRAEMSFALARRLDRLGLHDRAFAHLARANTLRHAAAPFDARAHRRLVVSLMAEIGRDFFSARQGWGEKTALPILVVGMPRSGSTLLEQLLGAHPKIEGVGESEAVRQLTRQTVGDGTPSLAAALADLDRTAAARLGEAYVGGLAATAPAARHLVDKMPSNYLRLGLVGLIAPNARIVWCRRDPLDTCLSCFFQSFGEGSRFAYDLKALGLVHRLQARLMRHWQKVLPNPIHEVAYEDLVRQPEATGRRLLAFLGVAWDPACLDPARWRQTIRTSSLWQARTAIHHRSIGRWRHYARHLEPLCRALDTAAHDD